MKIEHHGTVWAVVVDDWVMIRKRPKRCEVAVDPIQTSSSSAGGHECRVIPPEPWAPCVSWPVSHDPSDPTEVSGGGSLEHGGRGTGLALFREVFCHIVLIRSAFVLRNTGWLFRGATAWQYLDTFPIFQQANVPVGFLEERLCLLQP